MKTTCPEIAASIGGARGDFRTQDLLAVRITLFAVDPMHPYPLGTVAPAQAATRFAALLGEALALDADLLRLRYLPPDALYGAGAPDLPAGSRIVPHRSSRVDVSGGWAPSRLGRNARKSLRRRTRALEALGPVRCEELIDPAQRSAACKRMLHWKRDWLNRRLKIAVGFRDPVFQTFFRTTFAQGDPAGYRLFALTVNGTPVAYQACLQDDTRLLSVISSFDNAHRRFAPGHLLTAAILERSRALRFDSYDMLPPVSDYKHSLATDSDPCFEVIVPRTRLGRALLRLAGALGRA